MSEVWHEGLTLRSWHISNFKSVRSATVHLAPLTVVVGGNSAGKSTLLQSIRVASQAATSDSSVFPLNGEQFRPGTFAETRFAGADEADAIEIGGEFNLGTFRSGYVGPPQTRVNLTTRARPRRRRDEDVQLTWNLSLHGTPADQSAAANVQAITVTASQGDQQHAALTARATRGNVGRSFGRDQRYAGTVTTDDDVLQVVDVSISGGFPQQLLREVDLADDLFWAWQETHGMSVRSSVHRLTASTDSAEPREVDDESVLIDRIVSDLRTVVGDSPENAARYTSSRQLIVRLRELLFRDPISVNWTPDRLLRVSTEVSSRLGWGAIQATRSAQLPDLMDDALDEVRHFLANRVQHLGPLRMDPQVVYRSSPASQPGFIGAKGEYSASVLQTSGRQLAHVPMPPDWTRGGRPTLSQAVNAWAAYVGIGDSFETRDQGRLGLQLSVTQPDVDIEGGLDLTSVGTGVSQLLPVLVMCLHAPAGSLLLIEQPELHLNPAVQQRLADFLLAVARSGRQLILETHSDYLVSRLRRHAAEDPTETVSDLIRIVFAERVNGVTTYHEAAPSADGTMTQWPAGFFEEAAEDSYALLSAMLDRRYPHGRN